MAFRRIGVTRTPRDRNDVQYRVHKTKQHKDLKKENLKSSADQKPTKKASALSGYLTTASVCVPDVIGALACGFKTKKKKKTARLYSAR